jgi:chromosome segregation protein
MDRLSAEREQDRPGQSGRRRWPRPRRAQARSQRERAELTEAVARLRGSIGSLNREGARDCAPPSRPSMVISAACSRAVSGRQAAHLALVDSDDPLEAGLEIFAQPPGKRLQSLTCCRVGNRR